MISFNENSGYQQISQRMFNRIINGLSQILVIFLIINSSLSHTVMGAKMNLHFIKTPESTVAPLYDEVQFDCKTNIPTNGIEWRFRPIPLSDAGDGQQQSTNIIGHQHSTNSHPSNKHNYIYLSDSEGYAIETHQQKDMSKIRVYVNQTSVGEYHCIAWFGPSAMVSIPAKLTLASISLDEDQTKYNDGIIRMNHPIHWRVSPGNSVLIKCGDVKSNPSPVWSFYKDNQVIPTNVPQLATGTLILNAITQKDSGTYSCSAVNTITGNEIKIPQKITLDVLSESNSERIAPYFLVEPPIEYTVKPATIVLLQCPGIGNPIPKNVWSRPAGRITMTRSSELAYGLQIRNVTVRDSGIYICRVDNGIAPALIHKIKLNVLEPPVIIEGPKDTLTNESDTNLMLSCTAAGYPKPEIYWFINGNDSRNDPSILNENNNHLIFKSVEKRHAGIVQCFARNAAGEVSENNLLQVNPKSVPGVVVTSALGTFTQSTKSNSYDHTRRPPKRGKKKNKGADIMIPPSTPSVTRLSDTKVMVRWSVTSSKKALGILFFKVQYRKIAKSPPHLQWMTLNDDIPSDVRLYEVDNLEPDNYYRFRIAAVYTNNDNRGSNASAKFLLQRGSQLGPIRSNLIAPNLTSVEPISETSILLHWYLPPKTNTQIDGFYAYYRPATSAGEYLKATVDGMHIRQFRIDHLQSGTAYEFKLQSFTSSAASDFTAIITGKTLSSSTPTPTVILNNNNNAYAHDNDGSNLHIIAGVAVGVVCLLLFMIVLCLCLKRRRKAQREDDVNENKSHPDHIQIEQNGNFPGNGGPHINNNNNSNNNNNHKALGSPIHKHNRLNGVVQRMNITANPMAQDVGNNEKHQYNPYNQNQLSNSCSSKSSSMNLDPQLQPPQLQHQHQQSQQPTIRRQMDYNSRNVQYSPSDGNGNGNGIGGCGGLMDSMGHNNNNNNHNNNGSTIGVPSLSRRTPRRGSGSGNCGNGNNNGAIMQIPGSPKIIRGLPIKSTELLNNRSPMPIRAHSAITGSGPNVCAYNNKRNNRLGRSENISSGSLNSIEV